MRWSTAGTPLGESAWSVAHGGTCRSAPTRSRSPSPGRGRQRDGRRGDRRRRRANVADPCRRVGQRGRRSPLPPRSSASPTQPTSFVCELRRRRRLSPTFGPPAYPGAMPVHDGRPRHRARSLQALPQANDPCWCGSGRKYKRCHRSSRGARAAGSRHPDAPGTGEHRRPPYADTGMARRWDEPRIKSPEIIERMRQAGKPWPPRSSASAGEFVQPGVATEEIDAYVHELYIERNAYPSPLNYNGFPKSVCTSVNEVICHGIPDSRPSRTATSSTSTSPPTSAVCTATPTPRSSSATSTR